MKDLNEKYKKYLKENPETKISFEDWQRDILPPYVSDNFMIGPDGAYEHGEDDEDITDWDVTLMDGLENDDEINVNYDMDIKPNYKLTNWRIEDLGGMYRLRGQIWGRDDFDEGQIIVTTNLKSIDFEKGIAETKNSIYKLEKN